MELSRHMGVTARHHVGRHRSARAQGIRRAAARCGQDRRKVHVRLTGAGVRVREASSVLDPARVHGPRRATVERRPHTRRRRPGAAGARRPGADARNRARTSIPTWPKGALDDSLGPTDRCRSGRSRRARGSRGRHFFPGSTPSLVTSLWRCRRRPCRAPGGTWMAILRGGGIFRKLERLPDRYGIRRGSSTCGAGRIPLALRANGSSIAARGPHHRISHCRSAARGRNSLEGHSAGIEMTITEDGEVSNPISASSRVSSSGRRRRSKASSRVSRPSRARPPAGRTRDGEATGERCVRSQLEEPDRQARREAGSATCSCSGSRATPVSWRNCASAGQGCGRQAATR